MVNRHNRLLVAFHVATDATLGVTAFIIAYTLRFHTGLIPITKGIPPLRQYVNVLPLTKVDVVAHTIGITWEIEPVGTSCRLRVTHDQLGESANDELYGGWPMILSGLKTLLETGEELDTPGSLRYKDAVGDWS